MHYIPILKSMHKILDILVTNFAVGKIKIDFIHQKLILELSKGQKNVMDLKLKMTIIPNNKASCSVDLHLQSA